MDSYSLICFTKLYQLGSIHKAADELYISPQSMSKRLQRLEEELGQMLFERSPSGLAPTPHAHQLAYSANIILNEYERVRAVFNGARQSVPAAPETLLMVSGDSTDLHTPPV